VYSWWLDLLGRLLTRRLVAVVTRPANSAMILDLHLLRNSSLSKDLFPGKRGFNSRPAEPKEKNQKLMIALTQAKDYSTSSSATGGNRKGAVSPATGFFLGLKTSNVFSDLVF
jgi:hypothetical protein